MMKQSAYEMNRETFRSPRAERHWRNKQRELEKQQRKQPVGRVTWEEANV